MKVLSLLLTVVLCSTSTSFGHPFDGGRADSSSTTAESVGSLLMPPAADTAMMFSDSVPPPKWHNVVSNVPSDWIRWGKTAFRNDTWLEWLAITASTAILIATDEETYRISQRWHDGSAHVGYWGNFFKEMGDGRGQFELAGGFALYGLVTGDNRALRTGTQIAEVVLASGAVVQVLKHITGRASPEGYPERASEWKFFPNQVEYHRRTSRFDAFPSGHITTSLATVIVVAENYPTATWIRPVGYVLVGLIGVGMVNTGIHWYSDYPLGLAMGYAFGMIVSHPEGMPIAQISGNQTRSIALYPIVVPAGLGLGLSVPLN